MKTCQDCGVAVHEFASHTGNERWCEDCFDKGLVRDMDDHFKNTVDSELKEYEMQQNEIEKLNRYFTRTTQHIHRVQKNMLTLVTKYADKLALTEEMRREAMFNVFGHDRSKFSLIQFRPYVELTEYYHQRKALGNKSYDYPAGVSEQVDAAVKNHYLVENHHPERFAGSLGKYSQLEAIETVCDLQAMAQEFNEGSCRKYFDTIWMPKQAQFFYDDFNWFEVVTWMTAAIDCFEAELAKEKMQ